MRPRPAASPTTVPVMPEKITEASTLTWARPPRTWPTSDCAKSKIRPVIPAVFMSALASMKKGMAV